MLAIELNALNCGMYSLEAFSSNYISSGLFSWLNGLTIGHVHGGNWRSTPGVGKSWLVHVKESVCML